MNELLDMLNNEQKEAVLHFEGPLLILAGAGSGKTRVLTHRIAYLMEEHRINPYNILALTFTNKAAKEMRDRVDKIVPYGAQSIWVSTFHSTCVRILRRFIDGIGYDRNFTIYDADDQKALMKDICKHLNVDTKKFKEKTFLNAISRAKDELKTPEQYADEIAKERIPRVFAQAYKEYQKRLKNNNALDFDDLIMLTVQLFCANPEVLDHYQERFRFILVDEYQDTNTAQFTLLHLLAGRYKNLCVVGDDDQSIYKFRGANIYNILNFEKYFPETKTIRLEQNYRSTANILKAANEVIKNNEMRKEKALWTNAPEGEPIVCRRYGTEYEEAQAIASDIHHMTVSGKSQYSDFAILYRTNAQSRVFEEKLVYEGIPYRIIGAINFYARKEIKDLLCYLKTLHNGADDVAVKRIINIPRRGIGQTTIGRITDYALQEEISFYDALVRAEDIPGCTRALANIRAFTGLIEMFRSRLRDDMYSLEDLIREVIEVTGYVESLRAEDTEEAKARIENIDSLISKIVQYEDECEEMPTLDGLLEDIALVADMDTVSDDTKQVLLMTLHSAKGLEFPHVYMCGMEENVFPGAAAVFGDDPTEMEEERRLCYVGITRAMKTLTLTSASQRMKNGELTFNRPSRFLHEIPRYLLKQEAGGDLQRKHAPMKENASAPMNYSSKKASLFSSDRRNPFENNPYIQKGISIPQGVSIQKGIPIPKGSSIPHGGRPAYDTGDKVRHSKFGTGTVLSLEERTDGKDFEVVVEFEDFGRRKLRCSYAGLKKL